MINRTLKDMESKIQESKSLEPSQKEELLGLVADLKTEVLELSRTHGDEADSIVHFASLGTGEGLKARKNRKLLGIALDGVQASVEDFEVSHPVLVKTVNAFCTALANIGI